MPPGVATELLERARSTLPARTGPAEALDDLSAQELTDRLLVLAWGAASMATADSMRRSSAASPLVVLEMTARSSFPQE